MWESCPPSQPRGSHPGPRGKPKQAHHMWIPRCRTPPPPSITDLLIDIIIVQSGFFKDQPSGINSGVIEAHFGVQSSNLESTMVWQKNLYVRVSSFLSSLSS